MRFVKRSPKREKAILGVFLPQNGCFRSNCVILGSGGQSGPFLTPFRVFLALFGAFLVILGSFL